MSRSRAFVTYFLSRARDRRQYGHVACTGRRREGVNANKGDITINDELVGSEVVAPAELIISSMSTFQTTRLEAIF